ncbi:MAG: argininosuccinate synthase [Candidatus Hydrogenedentota bacterium]
MKDKVVLAYSGGLDTSVILKWLTLKGYDVIAFAADIGQREDFKALREKAYKSGASEVVITDIKDGFARDFIIPCIQFNARYEGRYLLGTSMARPCIAKEMVRIANLKKAKYVAHGATGKGNDQVRFEISVYALNPDLGVIVPWRDNEFRKLIPGRREAIEFAKKHNIPVKATVKKPWSSDENLMHISYESGILEEPAARPPEDMFERTRSAQKAPDKEEIISVEFKKGIPTAINAKKMKLVEILLRLNELGGRHSIGRIDMVESRFVGMKSRGVYETPGGEILVTAHRDLEGITLDNGTIQLKETLMPRFSKLVYDGFWFTPEMDALKALLKATQKYVTGRVKLALYKGRVMAIGRESDYSLYNQRIVSMEDDKGAFDQSLSTGFIKILSIPVRAHYQRTRIMR